MCNLFSDVGTFNSYPDLPWPFCCSPETIYIFQIVVISLIFFGWIITSWQFVFFVQHYIVFVYYSLLLVCLLQWNRKWNMMICILGVWLKEISIKNEMFDDSMVIAVIISIIVGDVIWLWKCFLIFQKDVFIFQNSIMIIHFFFYYLMFHFLCNYCYYCYCNSLQITEKYTNEEWFFTTHIYYKLMMYFPTSHRHR